MATTPSRGAISPFEALTEFGRSDGAKSNQIRSVGAGLLLFLGQGCGRDAAQARPTGDGSASSFGRAWKLPDRVLLLWVPLGKPWQRLGIDNGIVRRDKRKRIYEMPLEIGLAVYRGPRLSLLLDQCGSTR